MELFEIFKKTTYKNHEYFAISQEHGMLLDSPLCGRVVRVTSFHAVGQGSNSLRYKNIYFIYKTLPLTELFV